MIYRLESDHVAQLVADAVHHAEHAGPGIPRHHLPTTEDSAEHDKGLVLGVAQHHAERPAP